MNEKLSYNNYKFLNLLIAGFLATLVFNGVMYMDIAITGIPLDIPITLGQLVVGETEDAEMFVVNSIALFPCCDPTWQKKVE